MRSRPSVTDVARLAGVSVGTVSNVLNRPGRVSPATRERVERAIAQLEFVPSGSARQLRAGVAQSVGAVVLDLGNPFFTAVTRGIEDRLTPEGIALIVASSDELPSRESERLVLLEQHGVRGILVTPSSDDLDQYEALRRRGTPVVLMDAGLGTGFPTVAVDDVLGGRLAVQHLLDLGHRRIAVVTGPSTIRQCVDRVVGARLAVADAGLDPDEVLVEVPVPALNADEGEEVAHRLLARQEQWRPTGIFCVNDLLALGALRTLLRAGVSVPGQMAVVGYDDVPFASMLMVPLTTIRQPTHQIGWSAADLLLTLNASDAGADDAGRPAPEVQFAPELVVRLSSDPSRDPERAPTRDRGPTQAD
ncbi:MAG: LacI family DNA-binding transcriptional regulator [Salana multivorans]|uniref:LacI family DNA-binding transcriptional regulator n=1 Tax=Salana multivorans TaxID=120377 RepID=UPI00095C56D7|nr:LacI family DNA-binding transcriptional regulator [Salana multivorans]MBN8882254.1 LacI family DNA-binding transcriptional regulator [Salana multivorans]OJX96134.1 MAG: LacI family transcriptional regulator [Micrococcales bacterium 73-15]